MTPGALEPTQAIFSVSSYRFCRSDDLPLLAQAYNECFVPHFADCTPVTIDELKAWSRELDLWTSSCMVAASDEGPLAVLLAAKRERENLVLAVGARPGHERKGHGRHLLDSLQQKMAILGPPALRAEVPAEGKGIGEFFEACGYVERFRMRDYVLETASPPPAPSPLVERVTVADLDRLGALDWIPDPVSWWRSAVTLRKRVAALHGLAVVSDVRLEAFALYDAAGLGAEALEVWALRCRDPAFDEPMTRLLLDELRRDRPVCLPRLSVEELSFDLLEELGARARRETVVYGTEAS